MSAQPIYTLVLVKFITFNFYKKFRYSITRNQFILIT